MDSRHALALMVGTALAGPGVAQDQGPPTDEIGPVIVTAERYVSTEGTSASKSDIPLVEMPQSVSVVSRDMIDLLNWTSLNESVRYSAGATGEAFGPDERYDWLQIRGFDPVQFIDGVQAPIGSVNNTGTDLYGSEAVEVLKGPASVLYGQSPPGGIVNMVSRRPQDVFGGEIELQGGEYNMWQVAGDLTGPLGERTSGRITALYRDRETQVDFLTSKRLFISPAVKFEFGEDTELTLLANYQDDDLENQSTGFLPIYGTMLPNPLGKVPVGRNLGETGYNFFKREQWSAGYDFSHRFNDRFSIQQNLKYFDVKVDSRAVFGAGLVDDDFDGVPDDYRTVNRFDFPFNERIDSLSVDTRGYFDFATGGVEQSLLVGVDYRDYDGFSEFGFGVGARDRPVRPGVRRGHPAGDDLPVHRRNPRPDRRLLPGPAQVRPLHPDAERPQRLGRARPGGWRESRRRGVHLSRRRQLRVRQLASRPTSRPPRHSSPCPARPSRASRSSRPPATRSRRASSSTAASWAAACTLFGSLAAYEIVQQNVLTPDPVNLFFSVQEGEVEVKGVELEVVARIRERLTFNLAFTSIDTEITKTSGADLGNEMVAVPDMIASALVDYTFQEGPLGGFGFGLGLRHRGEMFGDGANQFKSDDVTMYDAILHYDTANWRIAVNASNFTDEIFVDRCSSVSNCFYGTRRLVTGSVTRKF